MTPTYTPVNIRPAHPRPGRTVVLALSAIPSLGGLWIAGALIGGGFGQLLPVLVVVALFGYRAVVRATDRDRTRAAVLEVGAVVLGLALAAGAWVALLVAGIFLEVLPFITDGPYPYADAWTIGSGVLASLCVPVWWGLLRRWADPTMF